MGMLLHRHRLERMAKQNESVMEKVKEEEIPFTEPEEPVEEPVVKKPRNTKPATVTRRRKPVK